MIVGLFITKPEISLMGSTFCFGHTIRFLCMSWIIYSVILFKQGQETPSTWKMVKYYPNNVQMNMIGLAHTSRGILEDGDVPILPVVLITTKALWYTTAPLWDHIIHLLCGV